MTFSIVACDHDEQTCGVAVASKFPAVGAVVPWAQAEVGAVATQSFANTSYGPRGLAILATGLSAQETLNRLLEDDPDKELRQAGLVDARGGSATFTGHDCFPWAGGVTGKGYAIQGNILKSGRVVPAMEKAFLKAKGSLPGRLHAALLAGDRAGGDKRGRQSAAIYVVKPRGGYGGFVDRWIDYRVDDHPDPVLRLGELLEMHELYFGKTPEGERTPLTGKVLDQITGILTREGYLKKRKSFKTAFNEFIGNENFEERADPDANWIDKPVLKYLIKKFAE
ncbi:MAG: fimbrial assembly protein FimA [Anaerolineales bacterium]|nr:MAG: fimbrial assembly protein FimA [Anaerolineales bacterium]